MLDEDFGRAACPLKPWSPLAVRGNVVGHSFNLLQDIGPFLVAWVYHSCIMKLLNLLYA